MDRPTPEPRPPGRNPLPLPVRARGGLLLLALLSVTMLLIWLGQGPFQGPAMMSQQEFDQRLVANEIKRLDLREGQGQAEVWLVAKRADQKDEKREIIFHSDEHVAAVVQRIERLKGEGHIGTQVLVHENNQLWSMMLLQILPWVFFLGFIWFFVLRQIKMTGAGGGVLSFGKSRANLVAKEDNPVTFKDVAGIDEATEEVSEIIAFLKSPERFQAIGARIPRGVLLVGAPGTGKTLLAKAIAGEADVPFYSIAGSDFVEMFVGVGASRVRDLFQQAKASSPCIVFLDEIDAVGRRRGAGLGGGHDEREQTLNAILVEMDGFATKDEVVVMAATNRPDVLDPALLRPGRFDRQITVDLPDIDGREAILKVHARKVKLGGRVDLRQAARATPGFSGAELEALINEAALAAAMDGRKCLEPSDLEASRDRIRFGREKRSRVMEDKDKRVTAYHEAGHAIVTHFTPEVEPLHKVTIIPRGMALGLTMQLPERDRYHMHRRVAFGTLMMLYGGRIAEHLGLEDISAGASNDIQRATQLARRMVCEWGMSEVVGPLNYSPNEEHIFLGRDIAKSTDHSEHTSEVIDREVRKLVDDAYAAAERLLRAHRQDLDHLAQALLRYETLSREEVEQVIAGVEIDQIRQDYQRRILTPEESQQRKEQQAARDRDEARRKADLLGEGLPAPGQA